MVSHADVRPVSQVLVFWSHFKWSTFPFPSFVSTLICRDVQIFNPLTPPPSSEPCLMKHWKTRASLWFWTSGSACSSDSSFPSTASSSKQLSTAKPLFSSAPHTVTNGTARPGISRGTLKTGPFGEYPRFYPRLSHRKKKKQPSQQLKMLTLKELMRLW